MRLICSLISMAIMLMDLSSAAHGDETVVFNDFEHPTFGDWSIEGQAFGKAPAKGTLSGQQPVAAYSGQRLANSFHGGDASKGLLTSPVFTISKPFLRFQIGGGNHPVETGIELLVEGNRVRTATGRNLESLRWVSWDVSDLIGKQAKLRIFDHGTSDFGHILVDHIEFAHSPLNGYVFPELEAYRGSDGYRQERFRPNFHFTADHNWINDPNGLVFFDGEYHLFYQHNPWGNSWGHMSWGHAVSQDLLHWKHLPVALYEDDGVMIFSGCCVVDHQNTSGFGDGRSPPMVAIYTGHGRGEQTQNLAYSNDRGRTWNKYSGNPVIDLNSPDFRDPKVFWHSPTKQWVMIVSLALQHRLFFYGSPDLKSWEFLSEFGPAGAAQKPNWECPDLFELPIQGEAATAWVLEVDLGDNAVAGGSGGEYFVGDFDGKKFTAAASHGVSWVDFGRDFYAPVSFANLPDDDQRTVWLGWMNNWETHLLPTSPWRGAMTIPREVSLRRVAGQLILCQSPVPELLELRGDGLQFSELEVVGRRRISPKELQHGCSYELELIWRNHDAAEFGIHLLVGEKCRTTLGYVTKDQQLYFDRSKSGKDSHFHPSFPGRHEANVALADGVLRLRIFVDRSSVEVFAQDGQVVMTERVFPDEDGLALELFSEGGLAVAQEFSWWQLKHAMSNPLQ